MKKEITIQAKTVDDAVSQGASQLGAAVSAVTYEVLEQPKKGFLGFGATPAKVRVVYETADAPKAARRPAPADVPAEKPVEKPAEKPAETVEKAEERADKPSEKPVEKADKPADKQDRPQRNEQRPQKPKAPKPQPQKTAAEDEDDEEAVVVPETPKTPKTELDKAEEMALAFLKKLIEDMEISAEVAVYEGNDDDTLFSVTGENAGILIGHHGDTLDALQYLASLAANRREEEEEGRSYRKITVDVENYRAKREATLRQLARRMSAKALKYQKNITLEPMNPYERRIIHSEVQNIEGVSTNSVGTDNNRRIVIYLTNTAKPTEADVFGNRSDRVDRGERGDRSDRGNRGRGGRGGRGRGNRPERPADFSPAEDRPAEKPAAFEENADAAATAPVLTDAETSPVSEASESMERAPRGERYDRGDRYGRGDRGDYRRGGRGGDRRGGGRGSRPERDPNRPRQAHPVMVEAPDGTPVDQLPTPEIPVAEKTEGEKSAPKKPYYMKPKSSTISRPYQKPVKKDSVESYYFDLENSTTGLKREKEEPSDIAKACGIYEGEPDEQNNK